MSAGYAFPPGLFNKKQAGWYLGDKSERFIEDLRTKGKLIAVGDGREVTFTRKELDQYIDSLPERPSQ